MSILNAFRCPECSTLIEIKDDNTQYITLKGSLSRGENKEIVASSTEEPFRICVSCLLRLLQGKMRSKTFLRPDPPPELMALLVKERD